MQARRAPAPSRFANARALLEKTTYRIACSSEDRDAVFRLRYEAYRREGGISANSAARFTDSMDETGHVYIIMMEIDGALASSIRLHIAGPASPIAPSAGVFSDILNPKLAAGAIIVDPTRHVANIELSRLHPALPFLTIRSAWLAAAHFGATHVLAAVRSEHRSFYKRVFGHAEWSEERPYPMLAKPIICLGLDFPSRRSAVERAYPLYCSTEIERATLFG